MVYYYSQIHLPRQSYHFGIADKAGKSYIIVQVGEESILYKSTKPSAKGSIMYKKGEPIDIMIDLRRMAKDEAIIALNKSLPGWIKIAQRGLYPWVIPVKICVVAGIKYCMKQLMIGSSNGSGYKGPEKPLRLKYFAFYLAVKNWY